MLPLAMMFSFLAVLLCLIHDYIGIFFGFFGWIFLKGIVTTASFFSSMKFAYTEKPELIFSFVAFYYVTVIFILLYGKLRKAKAPNNDL